MDRQLLLRLSPLLAQARALPADEWPAWAARSALSPADQAVLLKCLADEHRESDDPSARGPALPPEPAVASTGTREALNPGEQVGPWRLVRELGQGGMGVVWLAHAAQASAGDEAQSVALKIPHAGPGQALLAQRLQRERAILSSLKHPHIARLLDTGLSPNGLPYLALEWVEGQNLLSHASQARLGVNERLALMQQVLQAVQHAHNQLVLHRDLKPANILVTPQAQVKLLDFGIAKLLSGTTAESTELTRAGGHVLTPDYAAPEQIQGATLSTATDVYALGVVLYELLTGQRPYRLPRGTRGALEQAILSVDPLAPSECWLDADADAQQRAQAFGSTPRRLRQALAGDLDVIILKALSKSPDRRYPTADALAQDLERHLRQEPIWARGDSRWYRARRFMARHALVLGATAAVVAALGVGLGLALWQAQQARLEAAKATAIKDFMIGLFKANDLEQQDAPRKRQQSVQDLLQDSARALGAQGLSSQPEVQVELQGVVGSLLHDLQLSDAAIALRRQRVSLLQRSDASNEQLVPAWRDLADSQDARGDLQGMRQSLDQALALCRTRGMQPAVACHSAQVLLGRLDLVEHHTDDAKRRIESSAQALRTQAPGSEAEAEALSALSELLDAQGKSEQALEMALSSLSLRERLWGPASARLARLRNELGLALWSQGRLLQAEAQLDLAEQGLGRALGHDHLGTAAVRLQLARLRYLLHQRETDHQALLAAARLIQSHQAQADPTDLLWALSSPLEVALVGGQLEEASLRLQALDAALGRLKVPPSRLTNVDLLRAQLAYEQGRHAQAQSVLQGLLDQAPSWRAPEGLVNDINDRMQIVRVAAGQAGQIAPAQALAPERSTQARLVWLLAQRRFAEALPLAQAAVASQTRSGGTDLVLSSQLGQHLRLGQVLMGLQRPEQARIQFERAVALMAEQSPGSVHLASARLRLAQALHATGHVAQARSQELLAQAVWARQPSAGPHLTLSVRQP
jgi:eukaryotic-like serine/threonine-protein kinase